MSSIYKPKLKDGADCKYYYISYYFGYNEDGKPIKHQFSLKVEKLTEAEDMQGKIDTYIKQGDNPKIVLGIGNKKDQSTSVQTISQLVDHFLNNSTLSDGSRKNYDFVLKNVLIKNNDSKIVGILAPNTLLRNITKPTANMIFNKLQETYSQNSRNSFGAYFRRLFNHGIANGIISENPISEVKRIPSQVLVKIDTYTEEEIEKIEKYLENKNKWFRDFILIDFQTGLRKSELFDLTWADVNFKDGFLDIQGKGNKYRPVPLNEKAYNILLERKKEYDELKIKPMKNRVFWEVKNAIAVNLNLDVMGKKLGFKRTVHDIRHAFASTYLRNGGSIIILQRILGHANIKQTMRYAHFIKDELSKNIDRLTQYGA